MTTIFEALRADHDVQRDLVGKLTSTEGASDARRELFRQLRHELEAHAAHEERQFYVPLMQADLTQDKARHSIAEHQELDELVEKLDGYDLSSPHWLQTANELEHRLRHHLDEEEHELFQIAGKVLSGRQKTELADAYRASMEEERANGGRAASR